MPKIKKAISIILQSLLILTVVVVGGLYLAGRFGYMEPIWPYVVLSGSMEPSVPVGSVVFTASKPFGYTNGDIITFSNGGSQTTTHRVVGLEDQAGQIAYTTKGDANKSTDQATINRENVIGSVFLTLPYIGYAVDFAKQPYGFILLVIIPATIIVYEELKFLIAEAKKQTQKGTRKKKKSEKSPAIINPSGQPQTASIATKNNPLPSTAIPAGTAIPQEARPVTAKVNAPLPPTGHPLERLFYQLPVSKPKPVVAQAANQTSSQSEAVSTGINKAFTLIPALAAVTIFLGVSGSYFLDYELSPDNILQAAASFGEDPTPTPTLPPGEPTLTSESDIVQTLVINEVLPNSSCDLGGDKNAHWIEIYNGYNYEVDLQNYQLQDADGGKVALVHSGSVDLAPGEMALLAHDKSPWKQCDYDDDNGVKTANFGAGNLNLNTGTLRLLDSSDVVIDRVDWDKDTNPPIDVSIERFPIGWDTATADDFNPSDFRTADPPTPGDGTNLVLNEFIQKLSVMYANESTLRDYPLNKG